MSPAHRRLQSAISAHVQAFARVVKPGCTLRAAHRAPQGDRAPHRRSGAILPGNPGQRRGRKIFEMADRRQRRSHRPFHQRADAAAAAGSRPMRTSPNSGSCRSSATTWPSSRNAAAQSTGSIACVPHADGNVAQDIRRQRGGDEIDRGHAVDRLQSHLATRRRRGRSFERRLERGEDARRSPPTNCRVRSPRSPVRSSRPTTSCGWRSTKRSRPMAR